MDIRSWGQTFLARIKQLPSEASQVAGRLPETLSHLPEKAQAALQNLPQNVEDGAKALLANQEIAEGWKTVGQGVGELVGWQSSPDHVAISTQVGGPSNPVGNAIRNSAAEIKPPKTPTVPRTRGHAVVDQPLKPRVKPAPTPTPGADPIGSAVKQAARKVPAAKPPAAVTPAVKPVPVPTPDPIGQAVRQASQESKRVAQAARKLKPVEPAASAVVKPVASPARQALTNGARVPLKGASVKEVTSYASVGKHLESEAKLLRQTGNAEAANTLSTFAKRMGRADELYQVGNTPAASRMLHAKIKVGLRNPEVQDALRMASKADEVKAAFAKAPAVKPSVVKPPVAKPFAAAAEKMTARAEQLKAMGHPTEAKQLSGFATRLTKAGQKYAAGEKDAALSMFRRGLDGKTQSALKVSDKADEVFAAFGREGKAAKSVGAAASEASSARSAVRTVKASKGAVAEVAQETVKKGSTVARQASTAGSKAARSARAAKQVQAGGEAAVTTTKAAERVAKGARQVKQATQTGKAAKGAVSAAEAGKAAGTAAKGAKQVAAVAAEANGAAHGVMNGALGQAKNFFGKITQGVKNFFGKIGKTAGSSKGWQTIKDGFTKMLPGLKKALKSSFIFAAVFAVAENLFYMLKGERSWRRALGGIFADTLGGTIGGVISSLASGAAIAALGALGVVGWPLTLAAGAVGILGYWAFDRLFRNTGLYDSLTHLMT